MSDALELKKLKLQLAQVHAAQLEYELRMEERQDEIRRIQAAIETQEARKDELSKKIAELESK